MVDPKQLRIGNYVGHIQNPLAVSAVFRDNFFVFDNYGQKLLGDNISPISIIDVNFEDFGFKKVEDEDMIDLMCEEYVLNVNGKVTLKIINGLGNEWVSCNGTHILFLHQLQNLYFALTGLELDFI